MSDENRADRIAALLAELAELMASPHPAGIPTPRSAPDRLVTVEEAAERLNIGRTRMFALVKSGEIESIQIGRLRRIHPDALDSYTYRQQNDKNGE